MLQLLAIVLILWAGMVLGVSFIATPAKFLAPHLTMPVALEVGKATFHIFNHIEWVICFSAITLTVFSKGSLFRWVFTVGLLVLLFVKTFYLLPALDVRAERAIAGDPPNPGLLHWFYISADFLQILFASAGTWWLLSQEKT